MIQLGNVDAQIVWLLAMMQYKGITSHKIEDLLQKLTPGHAREIGDVFAGKSSIDLAFPDIVAFVKDIRRTIREEELNNKKGNKNGRK
jgi:hypothetical protein